ncbi:hypothetical protein [Spiroplasma melliferum]|uniref:Uncharacterized protein n=2 Tax=Spiroplasma melliferum TaxID=2134 RepID=A0AAI9T461_SPIME|nr:hypothetical protein [Spiroplasma melliferum]KAI93123.1 hypothetical protein SPM_000875 [Spiroplasma melliferum KC3]QCO24248.1 hypothetical protein SRED_002736 [Spiroplasma melliferum]
MDYNGNLVSVFIDNYDTSVDYITNEPKKSLYIPLFFDGYYYHLIRLTTQIPNKDEKNYIEIPSKPETELNKKCYARLDRKENEIIKLKKDRISQYKIIICSKINTVYRKQILIKCLTSPHMQPIYYEYLNKEIKKILI